MRLWYARTSFGVHLQRECPYQPHLQGFIAHTSMKFAGYVTLPATRDTVTSPSSRGWRRTSSTSLRNSGSSSKNSTELCARLISPGLGVVPPPAIAAAETV